MPLRRLVLDASSSALSAIVAGRRMRIADLGGARLRPDGFGARLTVRRLLLTRAAAATLNRVLGVPAVLQAGRSLGSVTAAAEPAAVEISDGSISMGGPETTFSKLESLQVQMGIWGASERWSTGAEAYFVFRLPPTSVAPDASAGVLTSASNDGISMEIHAPPPRNMLLRAPRIDLATRGLSATVGSLWGADAATAPIATLDLSGATFQIRPKVGVFELMGIKAISNRLVADHLNERFQTPGFFQAGETLARVTVLLGAE